MFGDPVRLSRRFFQKAVLNRHSRLAAAVVEGLEKRCLLSGVIFAAPVSYPIGGNAFAVTSADLAGDGIEDIVTANHNGTISVLMGNGNGTLKRARTFSDGLGASAGGGDGLQDLVVADLGNGHPDILVTNGYSDNVSILLGNGDGTFQAPAEVVVNTDNRGDDDDDRLAVGNLGNGEQDLVTARYGTVNVFLGNGDGTFQSPRSYYVGGYIKTLTLADINGDDHSDVVLADNGGATGLGSLVVIPGNGDGTFSAAEKITAAGASVRKVKAVADFNGETGFIVSDRNSQGVYSTSVVLGNGDGTFQPASQVYDNSAAAAADFNGDGNVDLLAAPTGRAYVLLGNGDGTFKAATPAFTISGSHSEAAAAAAAVDLTGNGKADFVFGPANGAISVLLNTTPNDPAILSGDSTTFAVGTLSSFTISTAGGPTTTFTESGKLPPGISLKNDKNGSATLSGKAGAASGGTYGLTLTAKNVAGTETQSFALTVNQTPAITHVGSNALSVGTAGSVTIAASGFPAATLSAARLPPGVTLTSTGINTAELLGTPNSGTGGKYLVTLSAGNAAGASSRTFTLTVDEAPAINSGDASTFIAGTAKTFLISTSGFPAATITEHGTLPRGVTLKNTGNGTASLSGTPAAGTEKTYAIVLSASNRAGAAVTQGFTLIVAQAVGQDGLVLLQDNFSSATLNAANWYVAAFNPPGGTYLGHADPPGSTFLGATQLQVAPYRPPVSGGAVRLPLDTYNPTPVSDPGHSFLGSQIISQQEFTVGQGLVVDVTAEVPAGDPAGIVAGAFLYAPPGSSGNHDEIDAELLTNDPSKVLTNVYANQPLNGGSPGLVSLPDGDITQSHTYQIEWLANEVIWSVDGVVIRSESATVPAGPMSLYLNVYVPAFDFQAAYNPNLQFAAKPAGNKVYGFDISSVTVTQLAASPAIASAERLGAQPAYPTQSPPLAPGGSMDAEQPFILLSGWPAEAADLSLLY